MPKAKYETAGVSFPDPTILTRAKERAKVMGISFSKYVALLIEKDLDDRQAVGSVSDLVRPYRVESPVSGASSGSENRPAVESPENLEAMAKLGVIAAGIQPRAKPSPSPTAALPSGSKSAPPAPARRPSGGELRAPGQVPKRSASGKPKPSSP